MDQVALCIADLHFNYASPAYLSVTTQLIKLLKPDYVIGMGDAVDAGSISSYLQDPRITTRLWDEIEAYNKQLDIWQSVMKKGSTFHQLEGNHSERASRFIAKNCREIHEIVKPFPELLKLKERSKSHVKFVWHPLKVWDHCKIHDVVFHHGVYFDKNLAVSNLTRYSGTKFLQAHSHRYLTAYAGDLWCASIGHGSDARKTNHISGPCSWTMGLGIVNFHKGKGHLEPIIVTSDGIACFRGKFIKG